MATISTLFRSGWITLRGRWRISNQDLVIPWPATEWTTFTWRYQSWIFQIWEKLLRDSCLGILETCEISLTRSSLLLCAYSARSKYDDYAEYRKASDWWSDFVTVQSKIDGSDNRTDYVIAEEVLSEMITKWTNDVLKFLLNDRKHRFSIHHPDFSVDNIFVDEGSNITCIIDWAFCFSVPLFILLTVPSLPQSRYEVEMSFLPAFENGFQYALQENTQRENMETEMTLCRTLSCSRPIWLLSRILNFDSTTNYYLFKALWDSIENHDQDISKFFRSRQSSQQYISLRNELKEDDQTTEQVTKIKREYFRDDIWRLTIARKLTLVSQWSLRYDESLTHGIRGNSNIFVANKKLWVWINNCLKP